MASVTLNIEERPQGAEVEVPYLGLLKNGETAEIEDSRWERFKAYRGEGNFPEDGVVRIDTAAIKEEAEERYHEWLRELREEGGEQAVALTGGPEPRTFSEPPVQPPEPRGQTTILGTEAEAEPEPEPSPSPPTNTFGASTGPGNEEEDEL